MYTQQQHNPKANGKKAIFQTYLIVTDVKQLKSGFKSNVNFCLSGNNTARLSSTAFRAF
jgi:hypothetical protein